MPTLKKETKWKAILAIEPSPRMGFTPANGHTFLGGGDMLYNYLNYILGTKIRESGILFDGVELVLWKGGGDLVFYSADQIQKTVHDTMLAFARSCTRSDSDQEAARFIQSRVSPLSTGKAIALALDKLAQYAKNNHDEDVKTLLFVMSDDPGSFSTDSLAGTDIGFIPDLTVFILPEAAVADGCGFISGFSDNNGAVSVYELRSWYRDFASTLLNKDSSSGGSISDDRFEASLNHSIDNKSGVCYGLYGMIKDALGVDHSHGRNM